MGFDAAVRVEDQRIEPGSGENSTSLSAFLYQVVVDASRGITLDLTPLLDEALTS